MFVKRPVFILVTIVLLISACHPKQVFLTNKCERFSPDETQAYDAIKELIRHSQNTWNSEALVERLYEFDKYVYIAVSYPESSEKIKMASFDYEFDSLDEVLGKSQFFFPSIAKNVEIADPANFKYEGNGIRASLLDTPDTQFNYFFTIKKCLVTRIEYQIEGGFDLKLSYKLDEESRNLLARANEEL